MEKKEKSPYFGEEGKRMVYERLTPLEAARLLGIEVRPQGANKTILCPNPEHRDRHYGSCVIWDGGTRCKCFACGESITGIRMVQWVTGMSWYDAMVWAAGRLGIEIPEGRLPARAALKYPLLTPKERDAVGLAKASARLGLNGFPKGMSYAKPEDGRGWADWDEKGEPVWILRDPLPPDPLADLARDDPELYAGIVLGKARERAEEAEGILRRHGSALPPEFAEAWRRVKREAEKVCSRFASASGKAPVREK